MFVAMQIQNTALVVSGKLSSHTLGRGEAGPTCFSRAKTVSSFFVASTWACPSSSSQNQHSARCWEHVSYPLDMEVTVARSGLGHFFLRCKNKGWSWKQTVLQVLPGLLSTVMSGPTWSLQGPGRQGRCHSIPLTAKRSGAQGGSFLPCFYTTLSSEGNRSQPWLQPLCSLLYPMLLPVISKVPYG